MLANGCAFCSESLDLDDWIDGQVCFAEDYPQEVFCTSCAHYYNAVPPPDEELFTC